MVAKAISFNLGLPETPLTDNQELYFELLKLYHAVRNLSYSLDAITGALTPAAADWEELGAGNATHSNPRIYMPAYEDLSYGNTIEIYDAGAGVGQAKKGTSGKVIGFCSAVEGTLTGDITEVTIFGRYPTFPAATLTPGVIYGQSGTAGALQVGGTQHLGFALSDTQLYFWPQI